LEPIHDPETNVSPKWMRITVILVLGATIVWGSQYLIIKDALMVIPLFLFQGIRHLIAFLGFFPWWKRFKNINKQVFLASLYNAITFYFLIFFISWGLTMTSSSEGAFMASLYVAFTPFMGYIVLKTKFKALKLIGVAVTVTGMATMLFGNAAGIGSISFVGDVLVLTGAFFNAIQIVLLEKYTNKVDTMLFVLLQMIMISAMLLGTSFILQETVDWNAITMPIWAGWIYLGIVAGTITLVIQASAQKIMDETRAALLYSLEPVFATFFGVLLGAEPLSIAFIAGAGLIMAGIVLASLKQSIKGKSR
nr:DMT family transporter [Candidatus Sigynarchaeota archaeon]